MSGLDDASNLLGNSSDGSTVGDAKQAASNAASGAKIGAKIGGGPVGAAVGGAVGAGVGLAKSKRGRKALLFGAVFSAAGVLAVPTIVIVLVVALFGGVVSGFTGNSAAASALDGLSSEQVDLAHLAAGDSDVPWEILAAIPYVQGNDPAADPVALDDQARKQILDGEAVAPYDLLYGPVRRFAERNSLPGLSVEKMTQPEAAGAWLARALASRYADEDPHPEGMDAGVVESSHPTVPDTPYLSIDTEDPSNIAAAERTKEAWIAVLSDMPYEGAEDTAEEVYATALSWHLGNAVSCLPSATGFVGGMWANPLIGALSSPYGMRLHPTLGVYKLHDGTDISGAMGAPVYAAGSGTVTVEATAWAGPHMVTIDHGNGVSTVYGHMSAALVATGDRVNAGTPIGEVGSEGFSTGPHLHFSVWENGTTTDPVPFMEARGVALGVDDPTKPVGTGATSGSGGLTTTGTEAQPGRIRFVTANLAAMGSAGVKADLEPLLAKADVIGVQEARNVRLANIVDDAWVVVQNTKTSATSGSGLLIRKSLGTVLKDGQAFLVHGVVSGGKTLMQDRWVAWADVKTADGKIVRLASNHWPPQPQTSFKHPEARRNFAKWVKDTPYPVLVAGDWNQQPDSLRRWVAAPNNLKSEARSIDGFVFDRSFDTERVWEEPHRRSDHNAIGLVVSTTGVPARPESTTGTEGTTVTVGTPAGSLPQSFTGTSANGETLTLNSTQVGYASGIAAKAAAMGVPDEGVIIAFMTVLVETKFKMYASTEYPVTETLPHDAVGSDHDSVGLFQQRPVSGWGSPEQLMQVDYSASAFFGGPQGPNGGSPRGLLDVDQWDLMPKGDAAQTVQVSAFPDRYAAWEQYATDLYAKVKGTSAGSGCGTTGTDSETEITVPATASAQVKAAIASAEKELGEPYRWGATGPDSWDCSGLMQKAWRDAGVTLPRVSGDQATVGVKVAREAISPGDLVFYNSPVSHVAMYIGDGKVIHAPRTGDVVKIEAMEMGMEITAIRRVATDTGSAL